MKTHRAVAMTLASALLAWANSALAESPESPIEHVVVIFQENVSFDHYFATYPSALNPPGEPAFRSRPGTPTVNGLGPPLLFANPNSAQPFRFDRSHAATCDQDHDYGDEQKAFHWQLGRIDQSFDAIAGSLSSMFDFNKRGAHRLFLDPVTGEVVAAEGDHDD